jgi:hypothetical protein
MTAALPALPEDPEDLRQYCQQLLTELSAQKALVAKLSHELALFRRHLYGRRSEQLEPAQLLLEFASWLTAMTEAAPAAAGATPDAPPAPPPPRPRSRHGRTPLPGPCSPAGAWSTRCRRSSARAGYAGAAREDRRRDE